jgi:hypothetical protein
VYVSCDPATLARDLRALIVSGYAIQSLTLADLFPQTFHLETVSTCVTPEQPHPDSSRSVKIVSMQITLHATPVTAQLPLHQFGKCFRLAP